MPARVPRGCGLPPVTWVSWVRVATDRAVGGFVEVVGVERDRWGVRLPDRRELVRTRDEVVAIDQVGLQVGVVGDAGVDHRHRHAFTRGFAVLDERRVHAIRTREVPLG